MAFLRKIVLMFLFSSLLFLVGCGTEFDTRPKCHHCDGTGDGMLWGKCSRCDGTGRLSYGTGK